MKFIAYPTLVLATALLATACSDDDTPTPENEEEGITRVTMSFSDGTNTQTIAWSDPDGDAGPQEPVFTPESLSLEANTTYTLSLDLENTLAGESINEEIEEEAGEHMFFFAWDDELFSDPEGNGNIDNRSDAVTYLDFDDANQPLGLQTEWTTGEANAEGSLQIVLKHQPDIKSATSESTEGGTDLDISVPLKIM